MRREQPIPQMLKERVPILKDYGVIEPLGHGRGTRYILSRSLYGFIGQKGVYTRKRGLDNDTNKELLLKHVRDNHEEGSPLRDLIQVLPALSPRQVQSLLQQLRKEEAIVLKGQRRSSRWFLNP